MLTDKVHPELFSLVSDCPHMSYFMPIMQRDTISNVDQIGRLTTKATSWIRDQEVVTSTVEWSLNNYYLV